MFVKNIRCWVQYPEFQTVSVAHRNILLLNTPNRLTKFEKNYKEAVIRKERSKIQPIFNFNPPWTTDGDPTSDNFYPQGGNDPKLNWKLFRFPKEYRVAVKPYKRFYVSTKNEDILDTTKDKLIVYADSEGNTIGGRTLKLLEYEMRKNYYLLLGPKDHQKKYWYPTSRDILDAVITVEKLYSYVLLNPLDTENTFKKTNLSEILNAPEKEKKARIDQRYKRLNLAMQMFLLFGISIHNITAFREFLLSQLMDPENLFNLGHNDYGYTTNFIIAISSYDSNPNQFKQNEIVKFFNRDLYEVANDIDPNYGKIDSTFITKKKTPLPKNTTENKKFLETLGISVKQSSKKLKEYYLVVALQSDYELHNADSDSPNCNRDGWFYRPEVYGRLITITPKEFNELPVVAKEWVRRKVRKKPGII